jgi:hypothetical protein
MIEVLPPLGKYKYDTWRILPVKCYIDNSGRLQRCKRNVNNSQSSSRAKKEREMVDVCGIHNPKQGIPEGSFPSPQIEQVVDLTTRCELLSFLDA